MSKYLKKTIIYGNECYIEVSKKEAQKAFEDEIDVIKVDDSGNVCALSADEFIDQSEKTIEDEAEETSNKDEEDVDDNGNDDEDDEDEDIHINGDNLSKTINSFVKGITRTVKNSVNTAMGAFNESFKDGSLNPKSKCSKLLRALPFMDDDEIHDLVENILNGDESVKDINIASILPFVSDEDADALFLKTLKDGNRKIKPENIAPFVSDECLSKVVDLYLQGKFPDLNVDALYPFLSSKDIKRIVNKIIKDKE